MSNRPRNLGFMANASTPSGGVRRQAAPDSRESAYDPANGPRRFKPADLTFGRKAQTLEELRAEIEAGR